MEPASGVKFSERAATNLAWAREMEQLERRERQILSGIRYLMELSESGENVIVRQMMLHKKLHMVQARIFRLRQGRLI